MKDTPCGRWSVDYSRERFLGETTYDTKVFDKETSRELVDLYNVSPFNIYFSDNYDYIFIEGVSSPWGMGGRMFDLVAGKYLEESDGRWYKDASNKDEEPGMAWPDDTTNLVRLDFFLTGENFEP